MASKQTYPCFSCRKSGYEIPVYLDGKDEQGRTKYLNEDGTKHFHNTKESQLTSQFSGPSEQQQQQRQEEDPVLKVLNDISIKIDYVIKKLDQQQQPQK